MKKEQHKNDSFINNFRKLNYMTDIDHTISTGNRYVDKAIGKYGAKAVAVGVKNPVAKLIVKGAGKVYPYVEDTFANIA